MESQGGDRSCRFWVGCDLSGKAAAVIGAAQGLGEAMAWALAAAGSDAVAADISCDLDKKTAHTLAGKTGRSFRTIGARVTCRNDTAETSCRG